MTISPGSRRFLGAVSLVTAVAVGAGSSAVLGTCGPFADVAADAFCPFVLEIFDLGITTGMTPTTYDPTSSVTRLQMAAFLSRAVDGLLLRSGRRAALNQFSRPQTAVIQNVLAITTLGLGTRLLKSDGADVWVARAGNGVVDRVRASDGKLLETWTGAAGALGALVAMGRVFVGGTLSPGLLYELDPSQAAGAVTTVVSNLGDGPQEITFDGSRIWTANGSGPSISIVTPGATIPWSVTTVTTGFSLPFGALFDGANVWVTDRNLGKIYKLDGAGAILQTVTVGATPGFAAFDGANIWVPNANSDSISVVRASSGAVLATLSGANSSPSAAAFDGQRILVTGSPGVVTLWKAADLTFLGVFGTVATPFGVCSDGVNFWITFGVAGTLGRF